MNTEAIPAIPIPKLPRERVNLPLRGRNKVDFGPPTTIKIERSLDTWVRNHCMETGRTFRSVLEDGLKRYRTAVELAPPGEGN